jgi:hypothetical protein
MSDVEKKEAGSTQGEITEEAQTTDKSKPRKRVYKDFQHDEQKPTRAYQLSSTCVPNRRSITLFTCRRQRRHVPGEIHTVKEFLRVE